MRITGKPDGEPQKVGVALVDVLAGLFATVGILTALHHRRDTGQGQRVDIDLLSCLLAALVNQAAGYTIAGAVPERMGNAHPSIAPYEVLTTLEGDLVLAIGTDVQFGALAVVLEVPDLVSDPRFATNAARVANRTVLRDALTSALATRRADDWVHALTAARVPAGVVNDIAGAFALAAELVAAEVADLEGALAAVNDTAFGLSASVFTRDMDAAMRFVHAAQAGVVHVNRETAGVEPHVPFGGVKGSSSLDREQGKASRRFFTTTKTVYLRTSR
jgi:crotonobetainyl-CoA:carnitine CoA-transferase CaiB-like acyl-CoA transferase